jgi:hypothetical protein
MLFFHIYRFCVFLTTASSSSLACRFFCVCNGFVAKKQTQKGCSIALLFTWAVKSKYATGSNNYTKTYSFKKKAKRGFYIQKTKKGGCMRGSPIYQVRIVFAAVDKIGSSKHKDKLKAVESGAVTKHDNRI